MRSANVRYWHKADITIVFSDVGFRRQSGHWTGAPRCLLMTQSGHSPLPRPDHASSSKKGFAIINAWLLAKVMATAEIFHVADNLKHEPLIFPVVFKSVVFAVLLVSF